MDDLLLYVAVGVVSCAALLAFWTLVMGRKLFVSGPALFLFWQVLFLIGTVLAVDIGNPEDQRWLGTVLGGMCCFVLGAVFANFSRRFDPRREIKQFVAQDPQFDLDSNLFRIMIVGMSLICVAVGILFAVRVGYNVFTWSLQQFWATGGVDPVQYSTMRTGISTGASGYVAPGYALQFTANLLPLVLYLLYFRIRHKRHLGEILFTFGVLLGDLYFLTISGGRGWLVNAVLNFVFLISPFGPTPKQWPAAKKYVVALVLGLMVFTVLSTTMMGRTGASSDPIAMIGGSISELYERIIGLQAQSQLLIARSFLVQPIGWGREWWQALVSVLPFGIKGFGLGNELHQFLWGSADGSLGLNVWASLWYNFGTFGAYTVAFFVGFLMQRFTITYFRGRRSLSRVVVLFVAGLRLSQFRDPYSLLLEGFVTIMVYYGLVRLVQSLQRRRVLAVRRDGLPVALRGTGLSHASPTGQSSDL